ncbi:uncharacterized protein LOC121952784 [Plectropomus leopardus]|uniref:uncharacterized protein LOC121952784 n=1 Tax=Plectropomus leopardus TaxID=160734 RepID=UPI001C4BA668|nr:uncharacterized protein LOC121952784 [Plectropomus leopardus]
MYLFQMTVWWQALILLCWVLNCVESTSPSPLLQRNKYNNSFRLTRSTRNRVQQLQRKYKEQRLGNKHFEDKSWQLEDLPSLSTDFYSWLKLTVSVFFIVSEYFHRKNCLVAFLQKVLRDWERLHAAFWDMQAYWNMLDWKRKQLEKEEKEQMVARAVGTTLPQSIRHIQLDLRDLMSQVSSQMSYMRTTWTKPTSPTSPLNVQTRSNTVWDSRVEGYVILRDLDLYLTKLARDFLLLSLNTHS